ncbi:MAG: O-antigen ligase family protein [Rhodobiaceae bacterium]|nr:O-antigen ligase family protein [Rhodobiaceae bacterium]
MGRILSFDRGIAIVAALVAALLPMLFGGVIPWGMGAAAVLLAFLGMIGRGSAMTRFGRAQAWLLILFIVLMGIVALQILPDIGVAPPDPTWQPAGALLGLDLLPRIAADLARAQSGLIIIPLYVAAFAIGLHIGASARGGPLFLEAFALVSSVLILFTVLAFTLEPGVLLGEARKAYIGYYTHGFVNRNSAATYVGIVGLTSALLFLRETQKRSSYLALTSGRSQSWFGRSKPVIWVLCTLLAFGALAMTGSRAGIGLFAACLVLAIALYGMRNSRHSPGWVVAGGLLVIAVFAFLASDTGQLEQRLTESGLESPERGQIYALAWKLILERPWLGHGIGSFSIVFPEIKPLDIGDFYKVWDRVHDTPLEIAFELGLPATVLLVFLWVAVFVNLVISVFRSDRFVYPLIGAAVWLFASLHSLIDFSLQIPGVGAAALVIVGSMLTFGPYADSKAAQVYVGSPL